MPFRTKFTLLFIFGSALSMLTAQGFQSKASPQESNSLTKEEENPKVTTETIFDVQAFIPGQTAHLVVILNIPEKWHIYWETPGESGMATSLDVKGPEGWTIGTPIFPGPELHFDEQENLCNMLEGEVGFFVPITPPDSAEAGSVATFQIKMSWLQCKGICLMGSFEGEVEHSVGSGLPKRVGDRRLVVLRNRLPRKGVWPAQIGVTFGGDSDGANLTFSSRDSSHYEFFSHAGSPMELAEKGRGEGTRGKSYSQRDFAMVPSLDEELEDIEVRGVLLVHQKGRKTYFEVHFKGAQMREPGKQVIGHGSLPVIPPSEKSAPKTDKK